MAMPWVLKRALDDLAAGAPLRAIHGQAAMFVLIVLIACVFRYVNRQLMTTAARCAERELRSVMFAHLQRLDVQYYQTQRVGDLMSRCTNDLNAVRLMVGPATTLLSAESVTFVIGVWLMWWLDSRLTLIALVPLPFVTLLSRVMGRRIHDGFRKTQAEFSDMNAILHESLASVRTVRAYRQEQFQIARFTAANEEYRRTSQSTALYQSIYLPSALLLVGIGSLIVLDFGGRAMADGRLTVGELVAFQAYLTMMTWPVISFGWTNNLIQRGLASWRRILEVLDAKPTIQDTATATPLRSETAGRIEIRHLTYTLGESVVLKDVSLVIPAGTMAAIVGATGSGKSVLLALVTRLYDPPEGTIFIDGVDVLHLPLSDLRAAIGYVSQDPFLFSATIRSNIAFGRHEAACTRSRIEWAAEVASLDHDLKDIANFPQGYDTVIGERGITLSGGQRQRVAIARAVLKEPPILALDDALSAVDTQTEQTIMRGLRSSAGGQTVVLVSHRTSIAREADQVFVLDEGRLVESGVHEDLVRQCGLYASFDRQQRLAELLSA
jgi:ATP-binding cassette subfamily B protein